MIKTIDNIKYLWSQLIFLQVFTHFPCVVFTWLEVAQSIKFTLLLLSYKGQMQQVVIITVIPFIAEISHVCSTVSTPILLSLSLSLSLSEYM